MALANDAIDLSHRGFVIFATRRLKDQVVDPPALHSSFRRIGCGSLVDWREVTRHRRERHEQTVVVAISVAAVLLFLYQHADHGVRQAADDEGLAQSRLTRKQLVAHPVTENNDARRSVLIVLRHRAADREMQVAEVLIRRPHPVHRRVCRVVLADLSNVVRQLRTNRLHQQRFFLDRDGVFDIEPNLASRCVATRLRAGLAAPDNRDVGAETLHPFALIAVEADAEADQQDHRRDAPDNAKHGEKATQLLLPQCRQRLSQDFENWHIARSIDAAAGKTSSRSPSLSRDTQKDVLKFAGSRNR